MKFINYEIFSSSNVGKTFKYETLRKC